MKRHCPICKSDNTTLEGDENTILFLHCNACGYNEADEYEADLGQRTTKSSGGTPYKRGGALRTQKK